LNRKDSFSYNGNHHPHPHHLFPIWMRYSTKVKQHNIPGYFIKQHTKADSLIESTNTDEKINSLSAGQSWRLIEQLSAIEERLRTLAGACGGTPCAEPVSLIISISTK
jgi:hypothetical protein